MGLFDKKNCDICGAKIGLLGNKKLADGNLCKDCAAKLSPHFNERRQATVEEIRQQLAYRERNKADVAAFHPSRLFGEGITRLQIDEAARRFTVCTVRELTGGNPDIVSMDDIVDAQLRINERRSDILHRNDEGKMVPDEPPRSRYSYDFVVRIDVKHPYFDHLNVTINSGTLTIEEPEALPQGANGPLSPALRLIQKVTDAVLPFDPHTDPEYIRLAALGEEACKALGFDHGEPSAEEAPAAEAEAEEKATPNFCPNCGTKLETPA